MEIKKDGFDKSVVLEDEVEALLSQQALFEEEVARKGITLGVSSEKGSVDSHLVHHDDHSEPKSALHHQTSPHKKIAGKDGDREGIYHSVSFSQGNGLYMTASEQHAKEGEKSVMYSSRKDIDNEGSVSLHGDRMFGDEVADHPGKSSHTTGDDIAKEALRSLSRKIRRSGTPKSRLEMLKADFRSSGVLALSYTGPKHSDYGGADTQYYARAQPCLFGYCLN